MKDEMQSAGVTIQEYIGKPYKAGASGPDSFDCWGLAKAIAAERGFFLPPQRSTAGARLRVALFNFEVSPWLAPILQADPWALVVFSAGPLGLHIATMTDEPGVFIHVAELTGTVRTERLRNPIFSKPYGFYGLTNPICRTAE